MSMYKQFATDANLESDGIWLDYDEFRVLVARAGGSNKKYNSYAETATKPFRRAIQAGTMSTERMQAILFDIYSKTVVLNWQAKNEDGDMVDGIPDEDNNLLEVTPENIVQTFKNLPALFLDIQQAAESISLYKKEEMEADSKN